MQHSVIFKMHENIDAQRIHQFFTAAEKLTTIQGVMNFKHWRQVSHKNPFKFGLSMEFLSDEDFRNYNDHPLHAEFIAEQWIPCVSDFLEIDLELLKND